MLFSPEMTFRLARRPYEIHPDKVDRALKAVVKTFKRTSHYNREWLIRREAANDGYMLEVCPDNRPFSTDGLDGFIKEIDSLFGAMRKAGFVPSSISKRSRDEHGRLIQRDWPGGGCHFHFDACLFLNDGGWYRRTELFHQNLVTDYANRPYIRWLLAQWFDDKNSSCLVTLKSLRESRSTNWDSLLSHSTNSIAPRFMRTRKDSLMTFELRFIDMVRNGTELWAVATLLSSWLESIRKLTAQDVHIPISITPAKLRKYGRIRQARHCVNKWLDSITAPARVWPIVSDIFERNYANRIRYGKLI